STPSAVRASASPRIPKPDEFSERKSSSMMTMGKRNFMDGLLGAWQRDALLTLILATAITIRDFADLVAFKKQHLCAALAGVDFGGQWRGVGEFQCNVTFPFGLQRGHVDDDAAARIGAFAKADS